MTQWEAYMRAGGVAYDNGQYSDAEQAWNAALKEAQSFGANDSRLATTINNLALLHYSQGNLADAESLYKRALAIAEKTLGPNHPDTARGLNNLATLFQTQAKYEQAESLLKRALEISEKSLGKSSPEIASHLNNLSVLYQAQGKYSLAEPLLQRALTINEKSLGSTDADLACTLNNLAELNFSRGNYEEAEYLYKKALDINERTSGPNLSASLCNLAKLYERQAKFEEAETMLKRALSIAESTFGENHPDVALNLNNLAALYQDQSKFDQAEPLLERALSINEELFGSDHPDVAANLNNLAMLYMSQNKYTESEACFQRAIAIHEKMLGPDHHLVAGNLDNLAGLYIKLGRYGESELLSKRALEIHENAFGPKHGTVAASLVQLANIYRLQEKYREAEPLFKRAMSMFRNVSLENDCNVLNVIAKTHENYASVLRHLNQTKKAAKIDKQAEKLRSAIIKKGVSNGIETDSKSPFVIDRALGFAWDTMTKKIWFLLAVHYSFGFTALPAVWIHNEFIYTIIRDGLLSLIMGGFLSILLTLTDGGNPRYSELFSKSRLFWRFFVGYVCLNAVCSAVIHLPKEISVFAIPALLLTLIPISFYGLCIVDEDLKPIEAVKRSWQLSKGARWKLLGFFCVLLLFAIPIALGSALLFLIPSAIVHFVFQTAAKDLISFSLKASIPACIIFWTLAWAQCYRQLTKYSLLNDQVTKKEYSPMKRTDFRTEQRNHLMFFIGAFLSIVGLIILCFNHSPLVLIPEGLLLTAVGDVLYSWLKRWGHDRLGPLMLHNPFNRLFIFLISTGAILGGLTMVWFANQLCAYALIAFLLLRAAIKGSKNSEETAIRFIVKTYKEIKRQEPDADEERLLELTHGAVLMMWGHDKEKAVRDSKERTFKSLLDVVTTLLITKDVYTGSNHMKYDMWTEAGLRKDEKRKALVDSLLQYQ